MVIKNYREVKEERSSLAGAEATLRWLISEKDGAKNFALRLFEIKNRGEKIPLHTHNFEHEIFVIEGRGKLKGKDSEYEVEVGDSVFIQAGEEHGFENLEETPFRFICVVPIRK